MAIINLELNEPTFSLTQNFSNTEIINASHPEANATCIEIDILVVEIAQYIRENIGKPVFINSAYRNATHNATIEGASAVSQHMYGTALDLRGEGLYEFMREAYESKNEHWQFMSHLGLRGLGFYSWGVHIDVRTQDKLSLWGYKKKSEVMIYVIVIAALVFVLKKLKK